MIEKDMLPWPRLGLSLDREFVEGWLGDEYVLGVLIDGDQEGAVAVVRNELLRRTTLRISIDKDLQDLLDYWTPADIMRQEG